MISVAAMNGLTTIKPVKMLAILAIVLLTASACSRDVRTEKFTSAAAGPLAALSDGAIVYAVAQTGAIYKVNADGSREESPIIKLDSKRQDPRGITGIAVGKDDQIFVSYLDPTSTTRVTALSKAEQGTYQQRLVWQAPTPKDVNSTRIGGALTVSPEQRLALTLGDRNDPQAAQGDSLLGKAVSLDPNGTPEQRPATLASGFIDPTAAVYDPNGSLWVADNGTDMKIKLSRVSSLGDRGAVSEAGTGPASGMSFFGGEEITLCSSGDPLLRRFIINDAVEAIPHRVITRDCNGGVATLPDSRVVYATPTELRKTV